MEPKDTRKILEKAALAIRQDKAASSVREAAVVIGKIMTMVHMLTRQDGSVHRELLVRTFVNTKPVGEPLEESQVDAILDVLVEAGIITLNCIGSEATQVAMLAPCTPSDAVTMLYSCIMCLYAFSVCTLTDRDGLIKQAELVIDNDGLVKKASELTQSGVAWDFSVSHEDGEGCRHNVLVTYREEGNVKGAISHGLTTTDLHDVMDDLLDMYYSQCPKPAE